MRGGLCFSQYGRATLHRSVNLNPSGDSQQERHRSETRQAYSAYRNAILPGDPALSAQICHVASGMACWRRALTFVGSETARPGRNSPATSEAPNSAHNIPSYAYEGAARVFVSAINPRDSWNRAMTSANLGAIIVHMHSCESQTRQALKAAVDLRSCVELLDSFDLAR